MVAGFSLVRRVEVHGPSMLPTLRPGDRLLAVRAKRARPGQLVVVRDPRSPERMLVKRLVAMQGGGAVVRGDNALASTDSVVLGPVRITATVVYRYFPADRSGRLSRGWGYHHGHG